MNRPTAPSRDEQSLGIAERPPGQLHDLPVGARWEVTRRHPYYLTFWQDATRYCRGEYDGPSERTLLDHAATLVLGAIGVSGEPGPLKKSRARL